MVRTKTKKKEQAAKEEEEEEEGIVPTKDPLRKPGVESNHQPFDLESNALPLAPPGLAHAISRQVSTKQQPFLFLFFLNQCTVYISSLEVQDCSKGNGPACSHLSGFRRLTRWRACPMKRSLTL